MMIEEFEQRTGYFPSSAEYKAIEAAYMEFDGDKDEFCKAYKKNANGIAERIRREVNAAAFKESRQHTADLTRRDIEIERLKKQLEREQEWKPYEDADAVSQADYDELATSGGTDKMTDDEAKALLYNWYGFAREMVVILRTAPIYEINRHRQLREVGAVDRAPLYNSTELPQLWSELEGDGRHRREASRRYAGGDGAGDPQAVAHAGGPCSVVLVVHRRRGYGPSARVHNRRPPARAV